MLPYNFKAIELYFKHELVKHPRFEMKRKSTDF